MKTRTLGEVCDEVGGVIRTGPFGSQLHESDYEAEGTPVVMPKNIVHGAVSTTGIARVGEQHVKRLAAHKLQKGDIVYGRRGDIGRQALIREREQGWLCGTGCLRIQLGAQVLDPLFLHYYLGQPKVVALITSKAVGATMLNLNTGILRSVPVTFPELPIQRKIAALLSAYDDLIENNTRRLQVLEEMAQSLYREWFVEMRFPGHEEAVTTNSEPGSLPAGWQIVKLSDAVELAYGRSLTAKTRSPGAVPVYGSSGITGFHDKALVKGPGIIVGRKGNVGTVFWSDEDFFPIDTVYYAKTQICLHYVFFNLQHQQFLDSDAAVPGLSRGQAYLLPFLKPSADVLRQFQDMVEPMFEQIRILINKNANLRRTRDLLLPKLLSGALDVSVLDIEGVAEDEDLAPDESTSRSQVLASP